jgi:HrpA-like RNA helicase
MMLFGAIFRCLEPTLTIAASLAFRSPFFSPFDKREEADRVKKGFDAVSDHITLLRAYQGWERCRHGPGGRQEERDYLHDNFLSGQVSGLTGLVD